MYSYARIAEIKRDLNTIINDYKANQKTKSLSSADVEKFESALLEYDIVLSKIGVGGFCLDVNLNKGFEITEHFISEINKEKILAKLK